MTTIDFVVMLVLILGAYGTGWLHGAIRVQRKWNKSIAEEIRALGGDPKYP
jgi:hypothetical protein